MLEATSFFFLYRKEEFVVSPVSVSFFLERGLQLMEAFWHIFFTENQQANNDLTGSVNSVTTLSTQVEP